MIHWDCQSVSLNRHGMWLEMDTPVLVSENSSEEEVDMRTVSSDCISLVESDFESVSVYTVSD